MSECPVRTISAHSLRFRPPFADLSGMNTMACRAVAQAGLAAGTASLDEERAFPLLLVAGWLTTAADLMLEQALLDSLA